MSQTRFRPTVERLARRDAPASVVPVPLPIPGLGGPMPPLVFVVVAEPGDVPPPPSVGG